MAYTRPTLQELIDRIESDFVSRLTGGGALLRRSIAKVIARVQAGASHHIYGYIAWMLKQVIVDTAQGSYLVRWAAVWGLTKTPAEFSSGDGLFTGVAGTEIPVNTELQSSDGRLYTTDAVATMGGGGTVTITVTAEEAGEDGDVDAGTELTLVSPIAGIDSTVIVDTGGISNGADEEESEDLLIRLLERIQDPPNGGAENDYIAWAKEVSGVTRAWVSPLQYGAGTLALLFVLDNDDSSIIPDAAKILEVQEYIDDASRRPVTADVTVIAPTPISLNPHITLLPNTTAVKAAVTAELTELLTRVAEPGAVLHLSEINEAISIATGETSHVLTSPVANITYGALEIGVLGTITWA